MNSFFGYADSGKSANFFVPTTPVWAADAGRIDSDRRAMTTPPVSVARIQQAGEFLLECVFSTLDA